MVNKEKHLYNDLDDINSQPTTLYVLYFDP